MAGIVRDAAARHGVDSRRLPCHSVNALLSALRD